MVEPIVPKEEDLDVEMVIEEEEEEEIATPEERELKEEIEDDEDDDVLVEETPPMRSQDATLDETPKEELKPITIKPVVFEPSPSKKKVEVEKIPEPM